MKLAIVKLSALGDIIHAMVVLQYIHTHFPDARVDWFVEERFQSILEENPHINTIYPLRLKHGTMELIRQYRQLKSIAKINHYDLVLDLQGLLKSALVSRILSAQCVGFDAKSLREPLAALLYHKRFAIPYEENVILRNVHLTCKALTIPIPMIEYKKPFLYSTAISELRPTLLIIVGSSWPSKIYPKEHFITIINALPLQSYLLWGNDVEKSIATYISEHTNAIVLPKMNLHELKALMQKCGLVIGGDSGPTHMAWAMNRPSITIFGPTPAARNAFESPIHKTIDCKKKIDPKHLNKHDPCIQTIDPQEVITLAKGLLTC